MNARNKKIMDTILTNIALNSYYTYSELLDSISCDVIARKLDFGIDTEEPISPENPNGELDFFIELGNILPFTNESADISIFEFDGKLSLSVVIALDEYDITNDERLNAYFASRETWHAITADSDPDVLRLEVECDANDLDDIAYKTEALLKAVLEDGGLASELDALGNACDDAIDDFLAF